MEKYLGTPFSEAFSGLERGLGDEGGRGRGEGHFAAPVGASRVSTHKQQPKRFHGAFTGGFSAGFFNSVGSREGWAPASFRSSRSARSNVQPQRVDDIMDDEDLERADALGGILVISDDFSALKYGSLRDSAAFSKASLPSAELSSGEIVCGEIAEELSVRTHDEAEGGVKEFLTEKLLHEVVRDAVNLETPLRESTGVKILKALGWRPGTALGRKPATLFPRHISHALATIRNKEQRLAQTIKPQSEGIMGENTHTVTLQSDSSFAEHPPEDAGNPYFPSSWDTAHRSTETSSKPEMPPSSSISSSNEVVKMHKFDEFLPLKEEVQMMHVDLEELKLKKFHLWQKQLEDAAMSMLCASSARLKWKEEGRKDVSTRFGVGYNPPPSLLQLMEGEDRRVEQSEDSPLRNRRFRTQQPLSSATSNGFQGSKKMRVLTTAGFHASSYGEFGISSLEETDEWENIFMDTSKESTQYFQALMDEEEENVGGLSKKISKKPKIEENSPSRCFSVGDAVSAKAEKLKRHDQIEELQTFEQFERCATDGRKPLRNFLVGKAEVYVHSIVDNGDPPRWFDGKFFFTHTDNAEKTSSVLKKMRELQTLRWRETEASRCRANMKLLEGPVAGSFNKKPHTRHTALATTPAVDVEAEKKPAKSTSRGGGGEGGGGFSEGNKSSNLLFPSANTHSTIMKGSEHLLWDKRFNAATGVAKEMLDALFKKREFVKVEDDAHTSPCSSKHKEGLILAPRLSEGGISSSLRRRDPSTTHTQNQLAGSGSEMKGLREDSSLPASSKSLKEERVERQVFNWDPPPLLLKRLDLPATVSRKLQASSAFSEKIESSLSDNAEPPSSPTTSYESLASPGLSRKDAVSSVLAKQSGGETMLDNVLFKEELEEPLVKKPPASLFKAIFDDEDDNGSA